MKEILKKKGLSTKGSKAELIKRLMGIDPHGESLLASDDDGDEENADMTMATNGGTHNDDASRSGDNMNDQENREGERNSDPDKHEEARALARQCELYRRETELAERELAITQRELELLRISQRDELPCANQMTTSVRSDNRLSDGTRAPIPASQMRVNVTAVADLLCDFDGLAEDFETWERQVCFLQTAYSLDNNLTKILIGSKLKGRALDWFHSKSNYIAMVSDELLTELRGMFHHRPNKITLRRRFEARMWRKGETFHDYVHEKVIMATRIAVSDDEILGYIIDDIPDMISVIWHEFKAFRRETRYYKLLRKYDWKTGNIQPLQQRRRSTMEPVQ